MCPCCPPGLLTLAAPLDFEASPDHFLSVEGSRGRSSLSDFVTVILRVADVNDNAPEFEAAGYSVEVPEDLQAGGAVVKVRSRRS